MLYTVIPIELVTGEALTREESRRRPVRSETMIEGGIAEGTETGHGFVLTRLISTDPRMYLDRRYQPGSVLKFRNEREKI